MEKLCEMCQINNAEFELGINNEVWLVCLKCSEKQANTFDGLLDRLGIELSNVEEGGHGQLPDWVMNSGANSYAVTLTYQGRTMELDYHQGKAVKDLPSVRDVIYTLAMDYSYNDYTITEFAKEQGLSWRDVKTTYDALKAQNKRFAELIGDKKTIQEIQEMMGEY